MTLLFLGASDIAAELGVSFRTERREVSIIWRDMRFGTGIVQDAAVMTGPGNIIARYADGAPAAAERDGVILAASGALPKELLRSIAAKAGVWIYSDSRPVYVNRSLIGVYLEDGRDCVLRVPKNGEYTDLFSGNRYLAENNRVEVPFSGSRAVMLTRT